MEIRITAVPSKLDKKFVDTVGTMSARFRAWGFSWVNIKVQLTCKIINFYGNLDNICEFSKLSVCHRVKKEKRKSVLKLVDQNNQDNSTYCHLGVLTIKLIFDDVCVESS